jgi:thioredoxin
MKPFATFLFLWALAAGSQAQTVLPPDAFEKAIAQPNVQILDVRTMGEYNTGYIKNALQADWNNKEQFNDRTRYLDPSKPVYVYCLSGGRSGAAATALREKGYNAINLEGGMTAWKQAGKPMEGWKDVDRISDAEYRRRTTGADLVLIDFGAPWCPPCKKMEPVLDHIRKNMAGQILVHYVDGGQNTELMTAYQVEALPTFIIYKKGREVWRKQGIVSQEEFSRLINSFQ